MNRKSKTLIKYIKMILLLLALCTPVLYIAGAPLAAYFEADLRMSIIKGAPGYPHTEENINIENLQLDKYKDGGSKMAMPSPGIQYGYIFCDRIGLSAPLYYGDDEEILLKGAGQYLGSGLPGSGKPILISAHESTFFAELEHIEISDVVTIDTMYGKYSYKVSDDKIITASDTTAFDLDDDGEILILYTCYPFGEFTGKKDSRFFVYCLPVSKE